MSIYNYTEKAQYEKHWTPETLMCRGLILNDAGATVSRPFEKFFNLEEMDPNWVAPTAVSRITEKMDGSLGIMYPGTDSKPAIATRGSFTSDQALHATTVLHERYCDLPWDTSTYTYLFEIIFPENRIVVDYHDLDDLILLAVIETATGKECALSEWFPNHVKSYPSVTSLPLDSLKALDEPNREGFVVCFHNGTRIKIKFAEYVRTHRLVTGVTARSIWELLATGQGTEELIQRVPEEFEAWVTKTALDLFKQFLAIKVHSFKIWTQIVPLASRKDQATHSLMVENRVLAGIVFAMLDHRPYEHMIWKMIRPKAEKPFTKEEDE